MLVGRGGERGSELGRVGCRKEGELALASGLAGQRHFWCVRACRIWAETGPSIQLPPRRTRSVAVTEFVIAI